jgi:AraC family transcriptional regulator of adaptative response/methylated-DNA-[protein]-cysteine methyltransferase
MASAHLIAAIDFCEDGRGRSATLYGIMLPIHGRGNAAQGSEANMTKKVARDAGGDRADEIRFAMRPSSQGLVLVAVGDRGIRAVLIGDNAASLRDDLDQRFPGAILQSAEPALASALRQVVEGIENPAREHDLVFDVRGTEFQRRVWDALRAIPAGETRSYTQIAKAIGAPTSVRAVAAACAANPIAVLIPCHRVVRGDGSLSGYRWGVERKRALLARERQLAVAA